MFDVRESTARPWPSRAMAGKLSGVSPSSRRPEPLAEPRPQPGGPLPVHGTVPDRSARAAPPGDGRLVRVRLHLAQRDGASASEPSCHCTESWLSFHPGWPARARSRRRSAGTPRRTRAASRARPRGAAAARRPGRPASPAATPRAAGRSTARSRRRSRSTRAATTSRRGRPSRAGPRGGSCRVARRSAGRSARPGSGRARAGSTRRVPTRGAGAAARSRACARPKSVRYQGAPAATNTSSGRSAWAIRNPSRSASARCTHRTSRTSADATSTRSVQPAGAGGATTTAAASCARSSHEPCQEPRPGRSTSHARTRSSPSTATEPVPSTSTCTSPRAQPDPVGGHGRGGASGADDVHGAEVAAQPDLQPRPQRGGGGHGDLLARAARGTRRRRSTRTVASGKASLRWRATPVVRMPAAPSGAVLMVVTASPPGSGGQRTGPGRRRATPPRCRSRRHRPGRTTTGWAR